jgi:hypothetical protein
MAQHLRRHERVGHVCQNAHFRPFHPSNCANGTLNSASSMWQHQFMPLTVERTPPAACALAGMLGLISSCAGLEVSWGSQTGAGNGIAVFGVAPNGVRGRIVQGRSRAMSCSGRAAISARVEARASTTKNQIAD